MICLKYTKLSAEVLFGKMRLKYNFTSLAIYCEMSVINNCNVHELLSRQYSFYFWKHLDIVRHIEFKNAFPQIRSLERKFEQRLARGLFSSRLSNLITIPDCSILNVISLGVTCFDISDVYCYPQDLYIELHRGTCRWLAFMIISRMRKRNSFLILRITIFELAKTVTVQLIEWLCYFR